jgi:hypothetical protein
MLKFGLNKDIFDKYTKSIEYTLLNPVRLIINDDNLQIDEIINKIIINPPVGRHLQPKLNSAGKSFSFMSAIEEKVMLINSKNIIKQINTNTPLDEKIKIEMLEMLSKAISENSIKAELENEVYLMILEEGLLTTEKGYILNANIFNTENMPISNIDYMAIMELITNFFFFQPYTLLTQSVVNSIKDFIISSK